jgi:hypothetical protein
MKDLRFHMVHGVTTAMKASFVLRRSYYGVRTSQVKASFTGINQVADGTSGKQVRPVFKSAMDALIAALPTTGEWLYEPPGAEHLGKGRWRITQEWTWAEKWSVMYGGTWNRASGDES